MNLPILIDCIKQGYHFSLFKRDILAGLTVSIVAIPLSIAFAIASGATPTTGLFTAIIGGFIVSFLGGSKYNISGPAGAFIGVIFSVIAHHGYNGLLISTFMAGIFLIIFSFLKFGTFISKIPNIIVIGFSLGLGIDIFFRQIPDFFGFQYHGTDAFLQKLFLYVMNLKNLNISSVFIGIITIIVALFVRKKTPKLPAFLIAIVVSTLITQLFNIKVETIYSRFGYIKLSFPEFHYFILEEIEHPKHLFQYIFPAFTIALLAGIEALLAATIADKMTNTKHKSNNELFAQGVANLILPLFGCLPVAGTTARTIVNVKSSAKSPFAGMFHALFIMLFLAIFSSLIVKINMPTIAGILIIVSVDMMSLNKIKVIMKENRIIDKIIVITTALGVIFLGIVGSIVINTLFYYIVLLFNMRKKSFVLIKNC